MPRNMPPALATFLASRPPEYVEIDFYEITLQSGTILRYCSYPGTINLPQFPPVNPPGGGGTPGESFPPLLAFVGYIGTGGLAELAPGWAREASNTNASASDPLFVQHLTTDILFQPEQALINNRPVTVLTGFPGPGQFDCVTVDALTAEPWAVLATGGGSWSNNGIFGISNGADPPFPPGFVPIPIAVESGGAGVIILAITIAAGEATGCGVNAISQLTTDPAQLAWQQRSFVAVGAPDIALQVWWAPNPQGISPNIVVQVAGLTSEVTVSSISLAGGNINDPWNANTSLPSVNARELSIVLGTQSPISTSALAGAGGPPPPPPNPPWIGNDVQIASGSGGKGGFDSPAWSCKLGATADQMEVLLSWFPAPTLPQDGPQSVIGTTPWPAAIRLKLLRGAQFSLFRAYWPSVQALLAGGPPIGLGGTDNFGNESNGLVNLFTGYVSAISGVDRQQGKFTIRDSRMVLDEQFPRDVYGPGCIHTLYDAGCTLVASTFSQTGEMAGVTANSFTYVSTQPDGAYQLGRLTYTDPELGPISLQISADSGTVISVSTPFPAPPPNGTAFTIFQGCDKQRLTCLNKFKNLEHFLGFPFGPPARTVS